MGLYCVAATRGEAPGFSVKAQTALPWSCGIIEALSKGHMTKLPEACICPLKIVDNKIAKWVKSVLGTQPTPSVVSPFPLQTGGSRG